MKYFFALLTCLLISQTAYAEDKPLKKKKPKAHSISKRVVTHWRPVAFNDKAERLPVGYKGLDPKQFYKMFTKRVDGLRKGEFETSEEFAKRTADKIALLSPINTSDLYAFKIIDIHIYTYNADAQAYIIEGDGSFNHKCLPADYGDWVTCKVDAIQYESDTYTSSNAYGANIEVHKSRGLDFSLAIQKRSPFLSDMYSHKKGSSAQYERYNYRDEIPVPLEKARSLKDMSIQALFVGRVTDAIIVEGRGQKYSATRDEPYDSYIEEKAVPFELKKIIYYVYQTGEILHQKSF